MDFNHLLPQWLSLPPAEVQAICFNVNTRELKRFVVSGRKEEVCGTWERKRGIFAFKIIIY